MILQTKLPRSKPSERNISAQSILDFIEAIRVQEIEVHSFIMVKNGHVIAETTWSPYDPEDPHVLNSLSKSFTSTAIGMAIDDGKLSLDDLVISFFPEEVTEEIAKNMAHLKVRHLLTMSTGHGEAPMLPTRKGDNWVKEFLITPLEYEPGTHFVYNTAATYMLSAILTKVTGMQLLDYLEPRLFEPLGMTDITTTTCPRGIHFGGSGMRVKVEDIAKFGLLYLQEGVWDGKRIISEEWVKEATKKQVSNGDDPNSDWAQGYGYQFWRCKHGVYRGDGAFGQYCIVFPEDDVVIAITSGVMDMGDILEQVWTHLLPAIKREMPQLQEEVLEGELVTVSYHPPKAQMTTLDLSKWSHRRLEAKPNEAGITAFSFIFSKEKNHLIIWNDEGEQIIQIGKDEWLISECRLMGKSLKLAVSGTWRKRNQLELTIRSLGTPFIDTWTCDFVSNAVRIHVLRNIWTVPGLSDFALFSGIEGYINEWSD